MYYTSVQVSLNSLQYYSFRVRQNHKMSCLTISCHNVSYFRFVLDVLELYNIKHNWSQINGNYVSSVALSYNNDIVVLFA